MLHLSEALILSPDHDSKIDPSSIHDEHDFKKICIKGACELRLTAYCCCKVEFFFSHEFTSEKIFPFGTGVRRPLFTRPNDIYHFLISHADSMLWMTIV